MAQDKRITPAEQLLSFWGDQNHTVTELFMVLYKYVLHLYDKIPKIQRKKYHMTHKKSTLRNLK